MTSNFVINKDGTTTYYRDTGYIRTKELLINEMLQVLHSPSLEYTTAKILEAEIINLRLSIEKDKVYPEKPDEEENPTDPSIT